MRASVYSAISENVHCGNTPILSSSACDVLVHWLPFLVTSRKVLLSTPSAGMLEISRAARRTSVKCRQLRTGWKRAACECGIRLRTSKTCVWRSIQGTQMRHGGRRLSIQRKRHDATRMNGRLTLGRVSVRSGGATAGSVELRLQFKTHTCSALIIFGVQNALVSAAVSCARK